jgi:hypothetical protein
MPAGRIRQSRPGAEVTSLRPREPLPLHPPESPGGRPVGERDSVFVTLTETNVKTGVTLRVTTRCTAASARRA